MKSTIMAIIAELEAAAQECEQMDMDIEPSGTLMTDGETGVMTAALRKAFNTMDDAAGDLGWYSGGDE